MTNDEVSMPNSIYPGAQTCLINNRDNDSIKGMRTLVTAPTNAGPRLPGKRPHASGKNPWIGMKAANIFTSIQGKGSRISHVSLAMTGQGKAG
jgi:hypothetical protein